MRGIHPGLRAPSPVARLVLLIALPFVLVVGLFAMHTMVGAASAGSGGAGMTMTADAASSPMASAMTDASSGDAEEMGCCGSPMSDQGGMMLMMACAFALLAGTLLLLAPAPRRQLGALLIRLPRTLLLVGGLPHPRPPSPLVLSISRT